MSVKLPKLEPDDYLNKGFEFWKEYRIALTELILEQENQKQLEKTPENIYKKAKKIGIKPTARYFNIQPSQVRYYVRKIENNMEKDAKNGIDF